VVCGDHDVADFARANGADVIWRPPRGLVAAVADGTRDLAARGFERAVIAHADLPLASDLSVVVPGDSDTVVLVPDRRNDGSNVLSIPLNRGFTFHYGPGSAAAHTAEAERCGLAIEIVIDEQLGWDVDLPEDLAALSQVRDTPTTDSPTTNTPTPNTPT
jgi:2-phospho-L-lactate guanylyltransferase (CobY/MobA/RfbA family)